MGVTLADGNYRLDIASAQVKLASDNRVTMPIDYLFGGQLKAEANNDNFFRLYGDDNGDGFSSRYATVLCRMSHAFQSRSEPPF